MLIAIKILLDKHQKGTPKCAANRSCWMIKLWVNSCFNSELYDALLVSKITEESHDWKAQNNK